MRKVTFTSLALFFLLTATAESAFACSCARTLEPLKVQVKKAFNDSTAIFSGKVISITPKSESEVAVKIKVTKSWKGKLAGEVTITTPQNSAMCGYTFEAGKSYLVYTNGTNDDLMTTNCSRTTLSSYKQDIKYLNKLKRRKVKSS